MTVPKKSDGDERSKGAQTSQTRRDSDVTPRDETRDDGPSSATRGVSPSVGASTVGSVPVESPSTEGPSVESDFGSSAHVQGLLSLQQSAGNQTVQRMVKHGDQSSLRVGRPNDRYEREAHRVARRVMRTPDATTDESSPDDGPRLRTPGLCPQCRRRLQRGEPLRCTSCEEKLQQKAADSGSSAATAVRETEATTETTSSVQSGGGTGKPLPKSVRSFFEPRLGYDLGDVRVHDDATAGTMNQRLDALAFTYGRDIYFRPETYAPHTHSGKRLLAHELTHVVQQTGQAGVGESSLGSTPGPRVQRVRYGDVTSGFFPPEHPTQRLLREHRELFNRAKYSSSYDQYTVDERIEMIQTLLNQFLVGPFDERALEKIWASFGDRLFEVANDHLDLWNRSWRRGAELTKILEVREFLAKFRQRTLTETRDVLEESRNRLAAERIRYGLQSVTTEHTEMRDVPTGDVFGGGRPVMAPQEVTVRRRHTEMAESPTTVGLAKAAELLAEQQRHVYELQREQRALVNHTAIGAPMGMPAGIPSEPIITDRRRYEELGEQIETAQDEKQALQATFVQQYPILAAFADGNRLDVSGLEKIAAGPSQDAAARLQEEIDERLENIEKVEEELGSDGDLSIWALPRMLDRTKQQMGIEAGSLQASMIDAKIDQVETDKTLRDLALGAIALGLGLLAAIPTGGSSLLAATAVVGATGSAAIGVYQAGEHYQQYQAEAAAANTAFDRARAISENEPSLFWLALDIVFAGLDLHPARVVFDVVGPAVKQAIREGTQLSREAIDAAKRVGPEFAQLVVQRVERLRSGSARFRRALTGPEEAAEAASRRLGEVRPVVEVPTELGPHRVKLTPGGHLVRCSIPCEWIRSAYATELAENPELARRLSELETQARRAVDDRAAARRIAEEARDLTDELEATRRGREGLGTQPEAGTPPLRGAPVQVPFDPAEQNRLIDFWDEQIQAVRADDSLPNWRRNRLIQRYRGYRERIAQGRRPTWLQSELEMEYYYREVGGEAEVPYIHGRRATRFTPGHTRPDITTSRAMIEVKNYRLIGEGGEVLSGRVTGLIRTLQRQVGARAAHGPAHISQQVLILDLRGQAAGWGSIVEITGRISDELGIPADRIQVLTWTMWSP